MRIEKIVPKGQEPGDERIYTIAFYPGEAPPEFEGTMDALMDALELHHQKALDYDGMESEFGMKGEIIGITRKVRKLKKILWDGKDPLFEGAQEQLMDLIGNALLTLRMQKASSDKYSASWRDNHSSKPTFGPGPKGHPADRAELAALARPWAGPGPLATAEKLPPGAVMVSHPGKPGRYVPRGNFEEREPRRKIRDQPQA